MATAFVLIGSIGGFVAALLSYLVLDAHALAALSIWLLSGPLAGAIVMLASQARQPAPSPVQAQVRTS